MQTNIISVKYEDKFMPKTFGRKAYSYYSAIELVNCTPKGGL